jgi:hypothetical protein
MTALDQAIELQNQAIAILLAEREAIDERLAQLGLGEIKVTTLKTRGRPPLAKTLSPAESISDKTE